MCAVKPTTLSDEYNVYFVGIKLRFRTFTTVLKEKKYCINLAAKFYVSVLHISCRNQDMLIGVYHLQSIYFHDP